MSANPDIVCNEAPAPQEPVVEPEVPFVAERGTSKALLFTGLMLFLLAAGVGVAYMAMHGKGGAASASAEVATAGSAGSSEDDNVPSEEAATATGAEAPPAECVGEIADIHLRWYCTQFLPFAKKAVADHDRLDRLEAAGKDSGSPGAPTYLWVILIGIGLLTVYNTVKIHSSPTDKSPNG